MDKTQDAQSVTQADRDAVKDYAESVDHFPEGNDPNGDKLAQAFARHRLASQPTSAEDAGEQLTLKDVEAQTIALMEAASSREGMKINDWVAARMREAAERALSAQQAATDEGEAYRRGIYDAKVWLRDQQHKNPPDSLWHAAAILADRMDVALLSTPTAQPPAAETRMRRVLAAIRDEGMQNHNTRCRKWWPDVLAALTQPEPTAQQGGGGQ